MSVARRHPRCAVYLTHTCVVCAPAGEITSVQALKTACEDVQQVCGHMRKTLKASLEKYKQEHPQTMQQ